MKEKVLISNQDKSARTMLRYLLEIEGYKVEETSQLEDTCIVLSDQTFDLVILDASWDITVMEKLLSKISQGDFGSSLHLLLVIPENLPLDALAYYQQLPISFQINRPFSPRDLIAMIRRCLHQMLGEGLPEDLSGLDIVFSAEKLSFCLGDTTIRLSKIEFDLFRYFFLHPNSIFSRKDLLNAIWGEDSSVEERTVDVHIRRLRRVLKPFKLDRQIQTVHGAGYRYSEMMVMAD